MLHKMSKRELDIEIQPCSSGYHLGSDVTLSTVSLISDLYI